MNVTVSDILEMTGMDAAKAAQLSTTLMQSYNVKSDTDLIITIAADTPTGVWKASGKVLSIKEADELVDRCRKEAPAANINLTVQTTVPQKAKNPYGALASLAGLAGQVDWNVDAVKRAANVLRAIGYTAIGLDSVVASRLSAGNMASIQDQRTNQALNKWLLRRATNGVFDFEGRQIEVIPEGLRKEAASKYLDMMSRLAPLDRAIKALSTYGRAQGQGDFMKHLKIDGQQDVSAATPDEIRDDILKALEALTDFSNRGVHTQAMLEVASEMDFIAELVLNNPWSINAMGYAADFNNPLASLIKEMRRSGTSPNVREAILYSESLYGIIMELISFAEGSMNMDTLAGLIEPAKGYLDSSRAFGMLYDQSSSSGITGIIAALRVSLSVGGISVSVTASFNTKPSWTGERFDDYQFSTVPNILGMTEKTAFDAAVSLLVKWAAGRGSASQYGPVLGTYVPENCKRVLQQVDWSGNASTFSIHLVMTFRKFSNQIMPVLALRMISDLPDDKAQLERLAYFYAHSS